MIRKHGNNEPNTFIVKRVVTFLSIVLLVLLFVQCAKVVAPTGGPKDITPPVMVKSNPLPYSTNFKGKKVNIAFNEFIQISEVNQKLIVSPPLEKPPIIKQKGKSFDLQFDEPLLDNTTYTLYFLDAIKDNNEGNKIPNFEFAFATGPIIDSLTFSGKVTDAYKLTPQEDVIVMLYNCFEDSLPLTTRPLYVSKTNKKGEFIFSNLKEADYKIFAITDLNSNYIFDQVTEAIAFRNDTVKRSMLLTRSDQKILQSDSTEEEKTPRLELRLFMEENRIHSLIDFSRNQRRQLQLGFTRKPDLPVTILPLNKELLIPTDWYISESDESGDTLTYWITDPLLVQMDTLRMTVSYGKTDSLMNLVVVTDTLRFVFTDENQVDRRRRRRSDETVKKPTLPVSFMFKERKMPAPFDKLWVNFSIPLQSIDKTRLEIINLEDSSIVSGYSFASDSLNPRVFNINYPWEPNVKYRVTAYPGTFVGIDSLANDTTKFDFTGADPETFGKLNLKLEGVTSNVIAELLTEKGKMVDRKIATKSQTVQFTYVPPGKYSFRFIIDTNKNGKWDTGWYEQGIQPERIIILEEKRKPKIFNVRANWEYDVSYRIRR